MEPVNNTVEDCDCGCDTFPDDSDCNDVRQCVKACTGVYAELCLQFICTPFKCHFKQNCIITCQTDFAGTYCSDPCPEPCPCPYCPFPPCHSDQEATVEMDFPIRQLVPQCTLGGDGAGGGGDQECGGGKGGGGSGDDGGDQGVGSKPDGGSDQGTGSKPDGGGDQGDGSKLDGGGDQGGEGDQSGEGDQDGEGITISPHGSTDVRVTTVSPYNSTDFESFIVNNK